MYHWGKLVKESTCHAEDPGSTRIVGRFLGEGNGSPLEYPGLEDRMDRGARWAAVHGAAESDTTEGPTLMSTQYGFFFKINIKKYYSISI